MSDPDLEQLKARIAELERLLNTEKKKNQPREHRYKFHWKTGDPEIGCGRDAADAFRNLGYGAGALGALDYHELLPDTAS